MKSNAIKVSPEDNVAVATQLIDKAGAVIVAEEHLFDAAQEIPLGHKVALLPLATGHNVIRYGEPIVETTQDVPVGSHVHVHNTRPIPGDA